MISSRSTFVPVSRLGLLALAISASSLALAHKDHEKSSHQHAAQHAHVHGVAALDVAVQGHDLVLMLKTPLADVVGFESAPANAEQKARAQQALETLREAEKLFVPTPAAQCKLESANIEADVLGGLVDASAKPQKAQKASDDHHDEGRKHDDHKHDHHGHDHDEHEEGHADLEAEYAFHCEQPQKLTGVDVKLRDAFPTLATINVQAATAKGQSRQALDAKNQRVTLAN